MQPPAYGILRQNISSNTFVPSRCGARFVDLEFPQMDAECALSTAAPVL